MPYSRPANSSNPSLFVIVMDQSGSMAGKWAKNQGALKSHALADIVNRLISDLSKTCISGDSVRDRVHLVAIGYGAGSGPQSIWEGTLAGKDVVRISEAYANPKATHKKKVKIPDGAGGLLEVEQDFNVWIEPKEYGGTPTDEAFDHAAKIIQKWINDPAEGGRNGNSFPPIVCHITDGMPNDPESAITSANNLRSLGTSDGNVLLVNIHIADDTSHEHAYATSESELPSGDEQARFLYEISSPIPSALTEKAQASGLPIRPNSRLMIANADAVGVISLLTFASTVGTKAASEPLS